MNRGRRPSFRLAAHGAALAAHGAALAAHGAALAALGGALLCLAACEDRQATAPREEGTLLVDSLVTITDFHFSRAACDEVLPDTFTNADAVPAGAVSTLEVRTIACYAVSVSVEDTLGRVVSRFQRYFDIPGRMDGEKERGVSSYVSWDGKDEDGAPVPRGPYLWRLDFRFGDGRSAKFRADMRF